MPQYVKKQLLRYNHTRPDKPVHSPLLPKPRRYGSESQQPEPLDTTPFLNDADTKLIQQVTGSFLYYARAVDPLILHALSTIASQQAKPTETTMKQVKHFLSYMAWHPDTTIRFYASDMVLQIHSDASYLTAPKARSRAGGHYFLGSIPVDKQPITLNGPVLSLSAILKCVAASAAEAELGALFLNAKEAKILRLTLSEMGHPQPPTPIRTDNSTAAGITNNTIRQRRSRSMDVRFYWVRDRVQQGQLIVYWGPGKENLGDFYTKHHPPTVDSKESIMFTTK